MGGGGNYILQKDVILGGSIGILTFLIIFETYIIYLTCQLEIFSGNSKSRISGVIEIGTL